MTPQDQPAAPLPGRDESDFSFRKMRLAAIVIIAQMFTTATLLLTAITFSMMPMTKEFGWSKTQFSLSVSALMWVGGIAAPLVGRWSDRVGIRFPILSLTALFGVDLLLMGFQGPALWSFYLTFGVIGIAAACYIPYSKLIGAMFTRHRGKALAIVGVESTIGAAIMPIVLAWLADSYGWRSMFWTCGAVVLALLPVLYLTLEEVGGGPTARRTPDRTADHVPGLTASEVIRSRVFWLVVTATIIGNLVRVGLWPHMVPLMEERGFGESDAVWFISVVSLVAPIGTVAAGFALDMVQTPRIATPFKLLTATGLLVVLVTGASFGGFALLMAGAAMIAISSGTTRPMTTYLHIRFFGLKSFGFYYGLEHALMAFVMGLMAPAVAWTYERSGSYDIVLIVMMAIVTLGSILYLFMGKYRYPADVGGIVPVAAAAPTATVAEERGPAADILAPLPEPKPARP